MNAIIEVKECRENLLFEIFFTLIRSQGGDGTGCYFCVDPAAMATRFEEWYKHRYGEQAFFLPRDEYGVPDEPGKIVVNFHDNNENYMFTNSSAEMMFSEVAIRVI